MLPDPNDNNEEKITITLKEYNQLLKDQQWLECLESAGVDNWEGISYAYNLLGDDEEDD